MWDKRAEYIRNHDGDNATMMLDQGHGDTKLLEVRLMGVFAPELREPGGKECQEFIEEWMHRNDVAGTRWKYIVITARMKTVDKEQMTFTRYVGTITSLSGASNLNAELIEFIRIKGYSGGIGS